MGIFPIVLSSEWCGEYEQKKVDPAMCKCGHFISAHSSNVLARCIVCGCAGFEVAE
jgi:hypothetical protein